MKEFREGLPIFAFKARILELVRESRYLVVTGDTGSGKTTQLPQYLLDSQQLAPLLGNQNFKIVVTQPRRMAAISMARRLCEERGVDLGDEVGYAVRFQQNCTRRTRIKFVTDGVLLRQCVEDPRLSRYEVVVLDEAHQRSLYTDILFALVKRAVAVRGGQLRLVVMSATLNTRQFSDYFEKAPVLQMHGKLFPVEVKYSPSTAKSRAEDAVKAAIRMHLHQPQGDILVFLTGSQECEFAKALCYARLQELREKGREVPGVAIYALYGSMSNEDQARVFQSAPGGWRKIMFSTNISETSLTIDGIGFVVDCGQVKQKAFSPRTNMDMLQVVPISKVQAIQRKGRAGRTQPGKCLRLYSEQQFEQLLDFPVPEIRRVSLTNIVLTLKALQVQDVLGFEYLEPPDRDSLLKALEQLYLLQAIDQDGAVTPLGLQMSRFPLEPSYAKALLTAVSLGCEGTLCSLFAVLSSESLHRRVFSANEEEEAEFVERHKRFLDLKGDHFTLLNIYEAWNRAVAAKQFCDQHFLSARSLYQARSIRGQLLEMCSKYGRTRRDRRKEGREQVIRCLVEGFYYKSARKMHNSDGYLLLHPMGTQVSLDIMSVYSLAEVYPDYLVFTELAGSQHSGRGVMHTVSEVEAALLKGYLGRTSGIDLFRLGGLKVEPRTVKQQPKQEDEEPRCQRQSEISAARERALLRKLQKRQ